MTTFKDKKLGTWYCKFTYKDFSGKTKQKLKRGFKLEREAKQWEADFKQQHDGTPSMPFKTLCEYYLIDIRQRLRPNTIRQREFVINDKLLPFFAELAVNEITPLHIREWKKTIKDNAATSQASYCTTLSNIFRFAIKYHGLKSNPLTIEGSCGSLTPSRKMRVWTIEEFNTFLEILATKEEKKFTNAEFKVLFSLLFYTGMRIGEALALTIGDYDKANRTLAINKTWLEKFYRVQPMPKTSESNRIISLPLKLCTLLDEYITHLQETSAESRLFLMDSVATVRGKLSACIKNSSLQKIHLHELRHSHASVLINKGIPPIVISKRLGHKNVQTTLNIYSHLYKETDQQAADLLNTLI